MGWVDGIRCLRLAEIGRLAVLRLDGLRWFSPLASRLPQERGLWLCVRKEAHRSVSHGFLVRDFWAHVLTVGRLVGLQRLSSELLGILGTSLLGHPTDYPTQRLHEIRAV